jgi:hypothetical protein
MMGFLRSLALLACSFQLLSLPYLVSAQDAPVMVQGGLEDATADDASIYNTGGAITVNGFNMVVPKNVLVQFPAAWVPWKDFVENKAEYIGFETLVRSARLLIFCSN